MQIQSITFELSRTVRFTDFKIILQDVASVLEESRNTRKESQKVWEECKNILQKSTIATREGADARDRLWIKYKEEADDFDADLTGRLNGAMDNTVIYVSTLLFIGTLASNTVPRKAALFTAVEATLASMFLAALGPDPNARSQAISEAMYNATIGIPSTFPPAVQDGPSTTMVVAQCVLYASLSSTLFVALGAVLGKQWLSHYTAVGERGTIETRALHRQRKLSGVVAWHLSTILSLLPILLQISLLLFGVSLCILVLDTHRTVGIVTIIFNGFGAILYFVSIGLSVRYEDCPFNTPLTAIARRTLDAIYDTNTYTTLRYTIVSTRSIIAHTKAYSLLPVTATQLLARFRMYAVSSRGAVTQLVTKLSRCIASSWRYCRRIVYSEAQLSRRPGDVEEQGVASGDVEEQGAGAAVAPPDSDSVYVYSIAPSFLNLTNISSRVTTMRAQKTTIPLKDATQDHTAAEAILWLLETSTDPLVHLTALDAIPLVYWPLDFVKSNISRFPLDLLDFLLNTIADRFRPDEKRPGLDADRVQGLVMAFLFIYWEKYTNNEGGVVEWTKTAGRRFVKEKPRFMEQIRALIEGKNVDGKRQEMQAFVLLDLTLKHHTSGPCSRRIPRCTLAVSSPTMAIASRMALYLSAALQSEDFKRDVRPTTQVVLPFEAVWRTYTSASSLDACLTASLSLLESLEYDQLNKSVSNLTPQK